MANPKAIEAGRITPRTTVNMKARLTPLSVQELEKLLGASTPKETWYEVTVSRHMKLVVQSYELTQYVLVARGNYGADIYSKGRTTRPLPGTENLLFTLSPGTKLSAVIGSDVLAFVKDYVSGGVLGQLTFRKGGVATFTPYTRGVAI